MQTSTSLQQFRTHLPNGIRIGILPAILINSFFAILIPITIFLLRPHNYTLEELAIYSVFIFTFFMLVFLLGIVLVSFSLAFLQRRLPNPSVFLGGFLIGTILIIIGNYILLLALFSPEKRGLIFFYEQIFQFISIPSATTTLLLAYTSQSIAKATNSDDVNNISSNSNELLHIGSYGAFWAIQAACIGCSAFVFIDTIYLVVFEGMSWSWFGSDVVTWFMFLFGNVLTVSLPFALVGGFLLGLMFDKSNSLVKFTKRKSIILGAITGLLTSSGILIFDGMSCLSFTSLCYADIQGLVDIINLERHYRLNYFLGWVIGVLIGALVGKKLYDHFRKKKKP